MCLLHQNVLKLRGTRIALSFDLKEEKIWLRETKEMNRVENTEITKSLTFKRLGNRKKLQMTLTDRVVVFESRHATSILMWLYFLSRSCPSIIVKVSSDSGQGDTSLSVRRMNRRGNNSSSSGLPLSLRYRQNFW